MDRTKENKPDLADLIRQNKKRHFSPTSDEKSCKDPSSSSSPPTTNPSASTSVHRERKSLIPPPTKSSKFDDDFEKQHFSDGSPNKDRFSPDPTDEISKNQSPKSEEIAITRQLSNQSNEMSDFEKRLLIAAKGSILSINGVAEPTEAPMVSREMQAGFGGAGLFPPFFGFGSLQMMPFVPPPPCHQTQVFGPPAINSENKYLSNDEHQKKKGKWCSMHVKLAWEIYHNAQYKKDRKKMKMMALAARKSEKRRKTPENASSKFEKQSNAKNGEDNSEKEEKKIEENASTSSADSNSQTSSGVDNDRPCSGASIPSKHHSTSRDAPHLHTKSKSKIAESTSSETDRNDDRRRNRQNQQNTASFPGHNFLQPQNSSAAQDFYVKSLLMNQFLHHQNQNQNRQFLLDQQREQQRLMYHQQQQHAFDRFSATAYQLPLLQQNQQDQHQQDLIAMSLLSQQGFFGFRQQQAAPFFPS